MALISKHRLTTNSYGSFLVLAMGLVLIVSILILPLMTMFSQKTKANTQYNIEKRSYEIAKAGLGRGLWYLIQDKERLEAIKQGQKLDGYQNDVAHGQKLQVSGYDFTHENTRYERYYLDISSGPLSNQITIVSEGTDHESKSTVRLTAVYEDITQNTAVFIESDPIVVDWGTPYTAVMTGAAAGPQVHWGPIHCLRGIQVDVNNPLYPRKFAKTRVAGRDNGNDQYANTDLKEYWAHYDQFQDLPKFSLEVMRQQADDNTDYFGDDTLIEVSTTITNLVLNQDTTWYFEGDVVITGTTFLRGIVVVIGDLIIGNNAFGGNTAAQMAGTSIPLEAKDEYVKYLEVNGHYPNESGFFPDPSVTTYDFPAKSVGMKASIYVGGDLTVLIPTLSPSPKYYIYGWVYVKGQMDFGNDNRFRVYYGSDAVPQFKIDRPSLKLVSLKDEAFKP